MPFCQTVPLLPSVKQQQHVNGILVEGSTTAAIPPTSSDVAGQHNKIGSIMFGAALTYNVAGVMQRVLFFQASLDCER